MLKDNKNQNRHLKFKIAAFLKDRYILIIAFFICAFLVFYNLGRIEFWGEDEGQTLLYASRFLIGLLTHSKDNITAFYTNSTLSSVILIQVPFIMFLGVREIAARMPSAIITVLTLFVIYKIGRLFLNRISLNLLVLLFAVSGAAGLFKTAIGVGFYIFFILLAFYKVEKFLFSPIPEDRGRTADLIQALIYLTLALVFVPDAYFFVPYFAVLLLINIKRVGIKKLLVSLISPVIIFAAFYYFQFIYPKRVLGFNSGTYDHLLGRKSGLVFSFNIKELLLGYITNYSIYFVSLFFIAVLLLIYLRVKKISFFPKPIGRIILLFGLHSIFWMFFVKNESGHLMNSYPVFMLIIAFSIGKFWEHLSDSFLFKNKSSEINHFSKDINNSHKTNSNALGSKGKRKVFNGIMMGLAALFLCLNFYHTFVLFDNLSLNKESYPLFYKPYKVPSGYSEGHKTGIKSAAYVLRKKEGPDGILVSDKGVASNFIYMGRGFTSYSSKSAIDMLKDGEDILSKYNIRFVAISPDYPDKNYIPAIEKLGFDKIVIKYQAKDIYYIYDVYGKNGKITYIARDEFDEAYNKEYINLFEALPDYVN